MRREFATSSWRRVTRAPVDPALVDSSAAGRERNLHHPVVGQPHLSAVLVDGGRPDLAVGAEVGATQLAEQVLGEHGRWPRHRAGVGGGSQDEHRLSAAQGDTDLPRGGDTAAYSGPIWPG